MKRYILPIIFTITVIALYHFITIPLFSLDLTRSIKNALFMIRNTPPIDGTVILFNVGKLEPDELQAKIDSLLSTGPKKIGINLCHWNKIPAPLLEKYKSDSRVVFANCQDSQTNSLSQIIDYPNTVTHFKTDKSDYFELALANFSGRGNSMERINYGPRLQYPIQKGELYDSYYWYDPDHLKDKIILLGYMGDYITDNNIYYYQSCRITPLNSYYGDDNIPPDMYDIEISANILRTIHYHDFIKELNPLLRVLIILTFSLLNVIVLTFIKTRWTFVNLLIAVVFFILLNGFGPFLMVLLFDNGYFLEMDELPLILVITTIFTVILNISQKKKHQ